MTSARAEEGRQVKRPQRKTRYSFDLPVLTLQSKAFTERSWKLAATSQSGLTIVRSNNEPLFAKACSKLSHGRSFTCRFLSEKTPA